MQELWLSSEIYQSNDDLETEGSYFQNNEYSTLLLIFLYSKLNINHESCINFLTQFE